MPVFFTNVPVDVGLLKVMLNLFHMIDTQGGELYLHDIPGRELNFRDFHRMHL